MDKRGAVEDSGKKKGWVYGTASMGCGRTQISEKRRGLDFEIRCEGARVTSQATEGTTVRPDLKGKVKKA